MTTAKKSLGQNFLINEAVLAKITDFIAPGPEDFLLEIGPGRGALTAYLLPRVKAFYAIELDTALCALLRERFGAQWTLIEGDALALDLHDLPAPLRVVGNLPYYVATPILFHLLNFGSRIRDIHVMVQKEVGERMLAMPSTAAYGRLSVMIQAFCDVEKGLVVKAGAFWPKPKVDSLFLRLVPKKALPMQDAVLFSKIVKAAFAARRKMLRNTLYFIGEDYLEALGIQPTARAENLGVDDFVRLADFCLENRRIIPI